MFWSKHIPYQDAQLCTTVVFWCAQRGSLPLPASNWYTTIHYVPFVLSVYTIQKSERRWSLVLRSTTSASIRRESLAQSGITVFCLHGWGIFRIFQDCFDMFWRDAANIQNSQASRLSTDWATERHWAPFVDNAEFAPRNGDGPNLVLSSHDISSIFNWHTHQCVTLRAGVVSPSLETGWTDVTYVTISKRHRSPTSCMSSAYVSVTLSVILSVSPRAKTSFSETCTNVTACRCMSLHVTVIRNRLVQELVRNFRERIW